MKYYFFPTLVTAPTDWFVISPLVLYYVSVCHLLSVIVGLNPNYNYKCLAVLHIERIEQWKQIVFLDDITMLILNEFKNPVGIRVSWKPCDIYQG